MGISRIEQYAEDNGIYLVNIPESDGCELSISYRPAVSFHSLQYNKNKVDRLLEIAHEERKYLELLPPTLEELGIDESMFNPANYINKILKANPSDGSDFRSNLRWLVSNKIFNICNTHLQSVKDAKFINYSVNTSPDGYCLHIPNGNYQQLAENVAEFKELTQVIKESISLIDKFFSQPSESLDKIIGEAKRLAERRELENAELTRKLNDENKHKHEHHHKHKSKTSSQGIFGATAKLSQDEKNKSLQAASTTPTLSNT